MRRFCQGRDAAPLSLRSRFRDLRLAVPVTILTGGLLLVSNALASPIGTLNTGSSGTVTVSLSSLFFNSDSAAMGGGDSDVAAGTNLKFAGCASGTLGSAGCLALQEGITVNNNDLTLTAPSTANENSFLTFAANPNLVFSINYPPGPGSTNTNCATANANGLSCSVFAGSPILLTYNNGATTASIGITGKASDTGVAGLAAGSNYMGGFSQFFTTTLPNGNAPTPANIQLYFCPTGVCQPADFTAGRSLTSSQSGTFFASTVPEPSTIVLGSVGALLLMVGSFRRKRV